MQSKQKKVKWSRGETASALEERTDTGITEVSVAKLQNIISDIYGNISRRPALKIIDYNPFSERSPIHRTIHNPTYDYNFYTAKSCVFTIDANSYIIFIRADTFTGFLIQNDKFVRTVTITDNTSSDYALYSTEIRTAQYNNYMVVYGLYGRPVVFKLTPDNNIIVEDYEFSAPWVAPNGTKTKVVDQSVISGLEINHDGLGFGTYTYTDTDDTATVYSWIDTGLTGSTETIAEKIPVGSIVQLTQIGTYMRVEGYTFSGGGNLVFSETTFNGVVNVGGTVPSTGTYALLERAGDTPLTQFTTRVARYINGVRSGETEWRLNRDFVVYNSASSTGLSKSSGSSWSNLTGTKVMMFGALLTPVADETAKDTRLAVEYGFISLQNYYPTTFTFSQQRLYASKWEAYQYDAFPQQIPGFAVGSQIGRYNDFKNDYNQENEPLNIDISTSFQEQIIAMKDYNGLKIFTDSAEYAYSELNGPVKQSENGSKPDCEPIVFGSALLYADKSNKQIRIMQYEFGANLFNSSIINQFAQEDLIFNTVTLVGYQDKEHCTGHFLYAIQNQTDLPGFTAVIGSREKIHDIAVCNLIPQNQAMIWSRWEMPKIYKSISDIGYFYINMVQNAIEINNKVWFVVKLYGHDPKNNFDFIGYTLAELDYEATMDFETEVTPDTTRAVIIPVPDPLYAWTATQGQETITVYTKAKNPTTIDLIYDEHGEAIGTILTTRSGPNTNIGGIDLYAWGYESEPQTVQYYTDAAIPVRNGNLYNTSGQLITTKTIQSVDPNGEWINLGYLNFVYRIFNPFSIKIGTTTYTCERGDEDDDIWKYEGYVGHTTISVFDGDKYMWDDTLDEHGTLTKPLTDLQHPKIGFKIDAELVSHPMDIGGKTYTTTKRIAKAKMVVRDTEPGAVQINDKYGYMDLDKKIINFYNVTGMKKEVRYIIKNNNGAKFTIESIMFDMEYGTLD